jgi:hypothetical protein
VADRKPYVKPVFERRERLAQVTEGLNGRVTDGVPPPP